MRYSGQRRKSAIQIGIPESLAHNLSLKTSSTLKAWYFPEEFHVFFNMDTEDFVIDGNPRGWRH